MLCIRVTRRSHCSRFRAWSAVVGLALCVVTPERGAAQVASGVAGAAGGLIVGGYAMTAIYVAEARTGRFLHSYDEMLGLRPELLPVIAGGVGGGWLGAESTTALSRAAGWGVWGLLGGTAVGIGVGHLIWQSSEGRWAGGVIGGAAGLVAGAILGAVDGLDRSNESRSVTLFSISLPISGRR